MSGSIHLNSGEPVFPTQKDIVAEKRLMKRVSGLIATFERLNRRILRMAYKNPDNEKIQAMKRQQYEK